MKITDENVLLLGNEKFCNKNEAINIAKNSNPSQLGLNLWNKMWVYVLTRKDIQGKDALKFAKDLRIFDLYVEVLKRDDISWKEAVEYIPTKFDHVIGNGNALVLYYIISYKIDMPIFQAFLYAKEFQPINSLQDYFECIFRRDDVKNLETKKLLNLAEKLDDNHFWFKMSLISRVQKFMIKVTVDKAYFYLNKFICSEMKNVILSRLDINQNIAIKNLKMVDVPTRISILTRPDIFPQKAIYLAKKEGNPLVLEAVLKREDVKEYLGLPNIIKEKPIALKKESWQPSSQVPYGCNW